jgi:hypothetical protein
LHIYDDASQTYSAPQLQSLFRQASSVRRNPKNVGADRNQRLVMLDFLESSSTHLLFLDSDVLLNTDWFDRACAILSQHVEVVSLYNSAWHKTLDSVSVGGQDLAVKRDLGALGTIISSRLVEKIVADVPASKAFDWDWSNYLTQQGAPLYALKQSAVQHVGIEGTNADSGRVDFGLGFVPDNPHNLAHSLATTERLLLQQTNLIEKLHTIKSLLEVRVVKYALKPWLIPRRLHALIFDPHRAVR